MPEGNGWNEYQMLVLAELKRLDEGHKAINARIDRLSQLGIGLLVSVIMLLIGVVAQIATR